MTQPSEIEKELLKYFWPQPYPQHSKPTQVIFSNGLTISDNDKEHKMFVIPFHTFKVVIDTLITQSEKQAEIRGRIDELALVRHLWHMRNDKDFAKDMNNELEQLESELKQLNNN